VAGVNAHINYDLAFALVSTWEQVGYLSDGTKQHDDYLLINDVFFDAIPGLRRSYLASWQLRLDRINGRVDDWYQNLLVQRTRDRAWSRAEALWLCRGDPVALGEARDRLDRRAARVGQLLLSPFCSLLQ
jgi:hypothetical protein